MFFSNISFALALFSVGDPDGIMTDYLWKDILTKAKLTRIIENYAQVVEETDPETKKKSIKQIFPRYHQLGVVESLLADVKANGVGKKYLIQPCRTAWCRT